MSYRTAVQFERMKAHCDILQFFKPDALTPIKRISAGFGLDVSTLLILMVRM